MRLVAPEKLWFSCMKCYFATDLNLVFQSKCNATEWYAS